MNPADLLPPGLGAAETLFLVLASFGTSFITAAFGIGGGILLLALFATLLPPAALIPLHGIVQLGSNFGRMLIMVRHVEWPILPGFLAGAVAGVALGGSVAVTLAPGAVEIAVGLFILWSVFSKPPAILRRWVPLTGAVSSFLTMFIGATGPFVASYLRGLNLGRERHVATHAILMTMQHVLKTIAFGLLGFAFGPWLPVVGGMIAAGFAGTLLGRLLLMRTTDGRFYLILKGLLIALALRLVWQGVASFA